MQFSKNQMKKCEDSYMDLDQFKIFTGSDPEDESHYIHFILNSHAIEKLATIINFESQGMNKIRLEHYLTEQIMFSEPILDRPRRIKILLKNDIKDAIYLRMKKILIVLEEMNGYFNFIKTIYDPKSSSWVQTWLSQNPHRMKFSEMFSNQEDFRTGRIIEMRDKG